MTRVVIDIPDSLYRFYKTNIGSGKLKVEEDILGRLLNDGTVLPKGHGDLIDRDEVRTNIKETCDYTGCNIGFDDQYLLKCTINNIGTVIPADKGE